MSTASSVRFSELTGLLERIFKSKSTSEKQSLLTSFISTWRDYSSSNNKINSSNVEQGESFYPVMRLIMPSMDKSRPAYGIRRLTLAKLYCDILCLGENHPDSKKLFNYKLPGYSKKKITDFADVAYEVLRNRSPAKGFITIEEINNRLDKISEAHGQLKKEMINENIIYIFQNTNALDQKWLIRMILKDVSCGMTSRSIFKCFHPLAEDFYNVTNDLEAVCKKFKSSNDKVERFDIQLFRPFKPMLSSRGDIMKIMTQLEDLPFIHELKFDGERVQIHKCGSHYRYWSRSGLEWTNTYGGSPTIGTLTPFIHNQFKASVDNCIIDGEMMGYNVATKTMGTKAEEFDIKSTNIEKTGYMPCFIAFDVLYLNDTILTNYKLVDRKKLLDKEILESQLEGKIQIAKWTQAATRDECLEAFNEAIENCEEGLMVKKIDSIYKVNCRLSGWWKMKPEYVLGLHEELDCVIVGGYFSGGNMIRYFLCAVKSDADPGRFFSFTRVGCGFTRKALYDFNTKMAQRWKVFKKESPPPWLVLIGKHREKPDVYIEPENSFVVQLKAGEIIKSDNYAAGCTLRFARIDCFREDKSPVTDCMSIEDLHKLRSSHKGKLAQHPLEICSDGEEIPEASKEKITKKRVCKRSTLAENFRSTVPLKKLNFTGDSTSIFDGKEFCVLVSDIPNQINDKKKIENFIYTNGGLVVQNPSKSTFAVIINKVTFKVQNLMKNNYYDIIYADWIKECIGENKYVELKPVHYSTMTKQTAKYFNNLYDAAGDSYRNEISASQLKILLEDMERKSLAAATFSSKEKSLFLDEIMIDDLDFIFLNGCVIHFYIQHETINSVAKLSERERLKCMLKLSGARIEDDIHQLCISHVITTNNIPVAEFSELILLNRQRDRKFYLVSMDWVIDSLKFGIQKNERLYSMNTS